MKISKVEINYRKKAFVVSASAKRLEMPFARLRVRPTDKDPIVKAEPDPELGNEAFVYSLRSGRSDTVHLDAVLDFNRDHSHLRELLLYKLSCEAQARMKAHRLSKRQVSRQLKTSPAHLYRLLDQTFYGKTVDQMIKLLGVLDCEIDLIFTDIAA